MLTSGNPIRRQDPPVTMTIALPHRLHGVFVEGAKKASMPLGMYVVQMIEAAWSERCGVAEAAPLPQRYVYDCETRTARPVEVETLQARVEPWLLACFGEAIAADRIERNHRFLEEALELVQSLGCTASEARQLVDYVYGRELGEPQQEVGGVMITLAALCLANDLDMHASGETELARIWTMVEKIRAKQAGKPKHSLLPEALPAPFALLLSPQSKAFIAAKLEEEMEPHEISKIYGHSEAQITTVRETLAPKPIAAEEITVAPLPPKALKPAAPAKEITPPARKLAPVEVRSIKGLLAAGMNTREITKDYGYTAAQIAAARGQS